MNLSIFFWNLTGEKLFVGKYFFDCINQKCDKNAI